MGRAHAVIRGGTPESVEADLAVMPRWVRDNLLRQLAEGEHIVIRTRQSPISLARYLLWPGVAALAWWFLVVEVKAAPRLIDLVFLAFLVGVLRLVGKEVTRRYTWLVATNKRILKHEGIVTRKVPMMRLTKITDMTYFRTIGGEFLGYGTIIIESAGQQQALSELTYIPDPDDVSQALNSEIFGEKPRQKKRRGGGSWRDPFRRGRPDDPPEDDGPGGRGPRGGGPKPRDGAPEAIGPVKVSPAGRPTTEPAPQESWYRSSNLGDPFKLGDTGEIPVVRMPTADEVEVEDQSSEEERTLYPPADWR